MPARSAPHVIREFIQNEATPEFIAAETIRLLQAPEAREKLSGKLLEITSALDASGASRRAASALLSAALPATSSS